jgi:hypothetical protein
MVDPTPPEPWHADIDDPLEAELDAESLVWASPPPTPNDFDPPSASL